MMTTIRLRLDATLSRQLSEVAEFEGKTPEGTLRLLIGHAHASMRRIATDEFTPSGPQPDDEIPM